SEIKSISSKKDFKSAEDPELKFQYQKADKGIVAAVGEALGISGKDKIKITAKVTDPKGNTRDVLPEEIVENNGEISVKLKKDAKFKPGLYKIILKIEEGGETQIIEYDFTWGVLAINVNKSIYLPNEEAYLQMAVLRDDGHTICDAKLVLSIKYQVSSIETILSTEDGTIQYSGECSGNNVTDAPDYFAHYEVGEAGTYQMILTNLDNGYEITDSFEVRDSVPFDVERIGPTRIYPPSGYEMVLKIKANQDFKGEIRESAPEGFEIKFQSSNDKLQTNVKAQNPNEPNIKIENCNIENSLKIENCKLKIITWGVDIKKGENYELRYTFDAPDVSPYIYLLGPLRFYE
ncbi:hypothetical protein KKE99_04615, partial [Patescibacteria group bacterium]|nr:hypothetical protein [Patescibacteria group bacterium]